jgi:ribose-phosphate pyrophosphokinase
LAVNRAVEPERPDTADPEASLAIGNEERKGHDENGEIVQIIGDVKGKGALIVDDFSLSAWTVVEAARAVMGSGASKVVALVTHGVFAEGARSRIGPAQSTACS